MQCTACRELIHAYVDGELDTPARDRVAEHINGCADCHGASSRITTLRGTLKAGATRYPAPDRLRWRVQQAVHAVGSQRERRRNVIWSWFNGGVSLAAAASLAYSVVLYQAMPSDMQRLTEEVVTNHTRAVTVNRLADVVSSDQHTVKPWFADKLDFSPPVLNEVKPGFTLTGGRLEFIAERRVAALAYRRRGHVINLYIWPDKSNREPPAAMASVIASVRGYQHVQWARAGMRFWAVSDLNAQELNEFQQGFLAQSNATNG